MTWRVWWIFLVTETVLSMTPGPAVLFVISQSLVGGASRGVMGALGIVTANVIWFGLSAAGLGALVVADGRWFFAIRWLGAAYLVALAIKPFLQPAGHESQSISTDTARASGWKIWRRGLVLQLSNPKALVFFVALLPQFVVPDQPIGRQILILGLTSVAAEFPVLTLYAVVAGKASHLARGPRFARVIDAVAAALLILAALGIALADGANSPSAASRAEGAAVNTNEAPPAMPNYDGDRTPESTREPARPAR